MSCFVGACPDPTFFEITDISSINLRFSNKRPRPWITLDENAQVKWDEYFIRFYFEVNYVAQLSKRSFGGTLQALDCGGAGSNGSKVGVREIYLRTLLDYNETFSSGDTINEVILSNHYTGSPEEFDEFQTVDFYLEENKDAIQYQSFELKITEPPSISGSSQQFELIYVLENGEIFREITDLVKLN